MTKQTFCKELIPVGPAKSVQFGDLRFEKKGDALAFLWAMLAKYKPGDQVAAADAEILKHALLRHPDATEKIGTGISSFEVRSADYGTQCFWVCRTDGSKERFSIKSCV